MEDSPGEVTELLSALKQGDADAEERLIALVYNELRRIAALYMRREDARHSLQPTALVHEAYLRLIKLKRVEWQSRSHFFAISATIMRRILVDYARGRRAAKRGDGWNVVTLDQEAFAGWQQPTEILALDEALARLSAIDARQGKIVELRFFAGMTEEEIGQALGICERTVKRDWRLARAWLYHELKRRPPAESINPL